MKKKTINPDPFFYVSSRKPSWPQALRISVVYICFGTIWILVSDFFIYNNFPNLEHQKYIGMFKGFLFLFISAAVIFSFLSAMLKKLADKEQIIIENRNELKAMLYFDQLTGLFNRRKLSDRLPEYLFDKTNKNKALILLDIDNIKIINDTLGHHIGDRLIIEITHRITRALTPPDEIFRLGGDELLILCKYSQLILLKEKAVNMLELFSTPFSIEGHYIHSTASIGISLFPIHSEKPEELLKFADMAMHQSKKAGKNCSMLYTPNMSNELQEKFQISRCLHNAIENLEMSVYYQPQIKAETQALVGFEALLRWNNPILGQVSPEKFISVAEETHLIFPIGEWVIRQACNFMQNLKNQGLTNLYMSINISVLQLLQGNFNSILKSILEEYSIEPHQIVLEITESVLIRSPQIILQQLVSLRNKGVRIALDDFGKGYSSLSYLEKLPLSTLKIDKSFIDGITDENSDSSLTGNIVKIGKKLGLIVIAEGVEQESQLLYLIHQQCDIIQGWYFSKALPESEAEQFALKNLERELI